MATEQPGAISEGGAYGSRPAAEGYRRSALQRARLMGPVTGRMLDLADIRPGSRVLDVAAGTGEQTLAAARRVGPTGSVLATDVAAPMLALAAEAAREACLANVETRVADARSLDVEPGAFDAAICRLALMLLPERHTVLAGIRRAMRPGGKLAVVVFSAADRNPYTALPLAIARRHAGLPPLPLEDPGMFALSTPGLLRGAYEQAGFREVVVQVVAGERRFVSVEEAIRARRDSGPEVLELLAGLSDNALEAAWAEIERGLRHFDGPDGVVLPVEYLIAAGTK